MISRHQTNRIDDVRIIPPFYGHLPTTKFVAFAAALTVASVFWAALFGLLSA